MVDVECRTAREAGVTFVAAVVRNGTGVRRRIRVEATIDGPAWPPRRRGVPVDGWEGNAYVAEIPPGGTEALGFASPAPPETPPVRVANHRRVAPDDGRSPGTGADASSADDVLRRLADPAPPREAVPPPVDEPRGNDGDGTAGSGSGSGSASGFEDADGPTPPPAVAAWLDSVRARVAAAEAGADAATVPAATAAVEAASDLPGTDAEGLAAVEATLARLEDDAAALRAVERRAGALAERADEAAGAVPVETLRTLS